MDESRPDRQLRGGEGEGLARDGFVDAVHLVENLPGHDLRDVELGIALAVAHPHFRGLLRHGLVRENTDPDAAAALDVARHCPSRGFDLARGEPAAADGLETVLAEADLVADGRHALVAALLLLAVLPSSRLQHSSLPVLTNAADAWALRGPASALPTARRCA